MLNIFVFGYVGARATFPGKDGDVEDEDTDEGTELSETGDEEPNPEEPKKDKDSKNHRGLLEIHCLLNFTIADRHR